ncbi:hypothetical protein DPEC_G00317900 [Dallia pectoralis]|uniref:Uncharacterized protein n=1 Tax=Dallia pectoralis TaxID=75939 RepID=A0ACC2FDH2_DALPE|nr:hypothetical protein DPEC_G00317900 [Dallia pectoralis]
MSYAFTSKHASTAIVVILGRDRTRCFHSFKFALWTTTDFIFLRRRVVQNCAVDAHSLLRNTEFHGKFKIVRISSHKSDVSWHG